MKEYELPNKAICDTCINYGGQCPYCDGLTCPRYLRNNRIAGLAISIAAVVIVIAISILCNYVGR